MSRVASRTYAGGVTIEYSPLDALIEQRPALDRGTLDTDRADNTVLTILDPLAITDEHTFRWGEPPHVYKVKAIDGLLQDGRNRHAIRLRNHRYPVAENGESNGWRTFFIFGLSRLQRQ